MTEAATTTTTASPTTTTASPGASGAGVGTQTSTTTTQPAGGAGNGQQTTTQPAGAGSTSGTTTDGQTGQTTTTTSAEAKPGEQSTTQPDTSAPAFKIPDEYKDKPWAAKIKSEADLFKQIDNLDTLVGKKAVIPDLKTATPEAREEFYKQLRPADPSAYKFEGDMASPDVKTAVGKIFMENGISEVQGNEIIKQYQAVGEAQQAAMFDPEGFKETMKGAFGDDWEKTTGVAYNNLKGLMTDQDQKLMEHLPNAYTALIYRTLGNVDKATQAMMQRYGVKETNLAHFADKANMSGGDVNAVRADLRAQMGRLTAGPHTADQIQELRTKLAKTYENDPRISQG
jgi:hypothetical protein